MVDTGHVLVKDTGVEASEAPVTHQLGLTVSFQEGEEEHGTATMPLEVILSQPLPPSEAAHLHEGVIRDLTSVISF